jgi:hypothetical protein
MGLDNDIYTILNTSWVIATIAKPTFHLNPDAPRAQTRHLYIQAQYEGTLDGTQYDNLCDEKRMEFELTGFEGSEDDCIKCIKVIKKLLLSATISGGHYHIDTFKITEINQLKSYVLKGHLWKEVEYDDF